MKILPVLPLLCLFALPITAAPPAKVKLTNKDGRIIEAMVLSSSPDAFHVRRADGKEFDIPLSTLTPASVEAARAAIPAAENPPDPARQENAPEKTESADRPLPTGKPAKPEDIPEKVTVKSGETIIATFIETATGLTKPVVVTEPLDGTPCFKVKFERRKAGDKLTFALVSGTYDKTVAVKCLARNKGSTKWYPTSIIPLQKGIPCGESWGEDVEVLVFYDFAWKEE